MIQCRELDGVFLRLCILLILWGLEEVRRGKLKLLQWNISGLDSSHLGAQGGDLDHGPLYQEAQLWVNSIFSLIILDSGEELKQYP